MIGTTVSHYRVTAELGRGGMGVVYQAEDTSLGRTVALKFLPPESVSDETARARFTREAKAASGLDHRNVCTIHEIGESEDGRVFIAMACYDGPSLKSVLDDSVLSVEQAVEYAAQAAEGLGVAHEAGIIHRDIKPGNLVIAPREVVKILDFGLAKITGATITKGEGRLGTILYMSPEQARGERVDYRTDIWSLGVVLYEMLTGEKPFQAPYDSAVFYSIINVDPKPPREYNADIPGWLQEIVLRCLVKDPDERYQSAEELAADLRRRAAGSSRKVSPMSATFSHPRVPAKRGVVAVAAVVLAALLAFSIDPVRHTVFPPNGSEQAARAVGVLPVLDEYSEPDGLMLAEGFSHYVSKLLGDFEQYHPSFWVASYTDALIDSLKSPEEMAGHLHIDRILRPDVSFADDDIVIRLDLLDPHSGEPVNDGGLVSDWSSIADLRRDLVVILSDLMGVSLTDEQIRAILAGGTVDPEAFRAMLLGWGYLRRPYDGAEYRDRAYAEFRRAAEVDSTFALARTLLASTGMTMYGFTRETVWLDRALTYVDEAIRLDSLRAGNHVLRGIVLATLGRDDEAESAYERARELDPGNRNAIRYYARLLERQNRTEEQEDLLLGAVESNPHNWNALFDLGSFYSQELRYEDAIERFERMRELGEDNAWAYVGLADQYLQLEDYARAESLYTAATTVNPAAEDAIATAYYRLGEVRYRQDDFVATADHLTTSLNLEDENTEAWSLLGDASHWLRRTDRADAAWAEAMKQLNAELSMIPDKQSALELLAVTQAKRGLEQEALRTIDMILSQERIPVGVRVSIGTALEILDRREGALEQIKFAIRAGYSREAIEAIRWLDSLVEDRRYTCVFEGAPCET